MGVPVKVRAFAKRLGDYHETGKQVLRAAGCAHVLVVSKWPPQEQQGQPGENLHTVQAIRWLRDGEILCRNSHGYALPIPRVGEAAFVAGYWIDVNIVEYSVVADGGSRVSPTPIPMITPEWGWVRPRVF